MMKYKGVILVVVICTILLLYYTSVNRGPGQYDDFAKCLTEKGISMAGTDRFHFCTDQKKKFGSSFKYVDYKNCDNEREWCSSNGVEKYPAWVFFDGRKYSGLQSLNTLATLSGCEL